MSKEMAVDYSSANVKRTELFFEAVNAQVEAETNAIIRDSALANLFIVSTI